MVKDERYMNCGFSIGVLLMSVIVYKENMRMDSVIGE